MTDGQSPQSETPTPAGSVVLVEDDVDIGRLVEHHLQRAGFATLIRLVGEQYKVVLERLSDALRHNHPALALVRGSAINHDGRSQLGTVVRQAELRCTHKPR